MLTQEEQKLIDRAKVTPWTQGSIADLYVVRELLHREAMDRLYEKLRRRRGE